jgi:hypothetical protein
LKSIREYKEAKDEIIKLKEAQLDGLKQQLEIERKNNDIEITEMHKKRYENLKLVLGEKENELTKKVAELGKNTSALLDLKSALENANKEVDLKENLTNKLLDELNRVQKSKQAIEMEKAILLEQIGKVKKFTSIKLSKSRSGFSYLDAVINNILVELETVQKEDKSEN